LRRGGKHSVKEKTINNNGQATVAISFYHGKIRVLAVTAGIGPYALKERKKEERKKIKASQPPLKHEKS